MFVYSLIGGCNVFLSSLKGRWVMSLHSHMGGVSCDHIPELYHRGRAPCVHTRPRGALRHISALSYGEGGTHIVLTNWEDVL